VKRSEYSISDQLLFLRSLWGKETEWRKARQGEARRYMPPIIRSTVSPIHLNTTHSLTKQYRTIQSSKIHLIPIFTTPARPRWTSYERNDATWPNRITGINWMKIVRIAQGRHRAIVRVHGDMEVQKHNGGCTSFFPSSPFTELRSCEELADGNRRQYADWLEELYNDILELIVSPPLRCLPIGQRLNSRKRIAYTRIQPKHVCKVRLTPSALTRPLPRDGTTSGTRLNR
jgi:hypothetical protein